MNTKYLTLSLISLLMIAGCQKEEPKTEKKAAASSTCRHPAVASQLHRDLQAAIVSETQKLIQNDNNGFVDMDKIIAAASQLKLTINGIQDKESQCRGKIGILIPQNIQKVAQANAPLVGIQQYDTIIEERMGSENFQFNGSTLTLPIYFSVSGEPISIKQHDQAFQTTAAALSSALLPYGVKDNLNVAGQTMTRDMALQAIKMNGGKLPTATPPSPPNTQPETQSSETRTATAQPAETNITEIKSATKTAPQKTTETPEQKALREAKAAEAAAKLAAEKAAARAAKAKAAREAREAAEAAKLAEMAKSKTKEKQETKTATPHNHTQLTPQRDFVEKTKAENKAAAKPRINEDELDKIRKAHSQADQEIKSSWKKISPEIQKELVEEQKSWEKNRNQRCRQAASAGADESEANKLYMQCDTRMTKERVKNLEGYSIP